MPAPFPFGKLQAVRPTAADRSAAPEHNNSSQVMLLSKKMFTFTDISEAELSDHTINMKNEISFLCLCSLATTAVAQLSNRPNVVFIYADDLGRGMLSHYGQRLISTPNIDRLFQQGTAFEYAYGCMFSAPARASLLTGYHDCRRDKWNISPGGQFRKGITYAALDSIEKRLNATAVTLPEDDLLLPQIFKRAGYVTAQVGKLDWGFTVTRQQLRRHGWDYYCGYLDHQHAHVFYPHFLFENDSLLILSQNTHPTEGRGFEAESAESYRKRHDMTGKAVYSQDLFLERILAFIRNHRERPFFLFHSTQLPHGPVAIPQVHPSVKERTDLSEIEKEYASMVLKLDEHVGIILNELERLHLRDNTIIIFSADNGHETYYTSGQRCRKNPPCDMQGRPFDAWDYPYRSDRTGDLFDGNNGLSGKKWMNWEGSVRVPLVFCWPGRIAAEKVSRQVVSNYDLLPTFADLFGINLPTAKDGLSLLPVLTGGKDSLADYRTVIVNSPEGPAVIDSRHWKLRYNKHRKVYRLHYLPEDYREERLLNDSHPEILEQLKEILKPYCN